MNCIELFESAPEDKTRVEYIDKNAPECTCENQQVSKYCNEPVASDEVLVRLVMDPTHTEGDGDSKRVTSALFSDAATFGSSCLRRVRATAEEYHETIQEMLRERSKASDGTLKALYGIVLVPVDKLKELMHEIEAKDKSVEKSTAFCVYATGLDKRPNHADIMTNKMPSIPKSKANRAVKNLMKAVSENFLSPAEFAAEIDLSRWSRDEIEKKAQLEGSDGGVKKQPLT